MSWRASTTTRPVIILVMEAMGRATLEFFSNSTSELAWSSTSATLDLRSSGSRVRFRPARSPMVGIGAAMGTATLLTF